MTPFLHEADALMDAVSSGRLDQARQHESQIVAYYCISHALWLGQNVHSKNDECIAFLCNLTAWQGHLKPHPSHIQHKSLDQNRVCEAFESVAVLYHGQRNDRSSEAPKRTSVPLEQCCLSTGPTTASVQVFENERHAPFVGWSVKHLIPFERGQYSNETGSVTIEDPVSSHADDLPFKTTAPPPLDAFVWDGKWSVDLMHTECDQNGWSYGLTWWMLASRLKQGNSLLSPGMSLVRRRKWVRHLRASIGRNLPIAIDRAPHVQSLQPREVNVPGVTIKPVVRELHQQLHTPAKTVHPVNTSNSPLPWAPLPLPAELPLEDKNVLTTHAFHAIKLAEDMMHHSDPLHMRRWFHAAAIYFEVIHSFGDLNPELDAQRQRARRLSRLCSHLHENCVAEHDAASCQVADVYEIPEGRVLGRGSYGTVCLATHRVTREDYACKVLCINRVGKQYVDKLHAEISSMRQLDHPNVLRLREVFFGRRKMCLIMDLCTGGELFELVNTSIEHRSESHATRFLAEMLSAVKYLHENGVVHRDLKLENWLFERHAGSHLKLIDFGLARHFLGHERMHGAVGSMYYVAPEVLQGSYDARCDLWSLGVISYMLVSGAPPFWGTDDCDIRQNILAGRWEFPLQFFAHVSPMAKDFIARLLSHDPDMRMGASEALSHPWLSASIRMHDLNILPRRQRNELLWTLQGFAATNALQKVIFAVAAFHLTPPRVAKARELFELIDIDRSGTISFAELTRAVRVLTSNSEDDEMDASFHEIFNAVDISRSSQIAFTEFLAATLWQHIQQLGETHVRRVFDTIDVYGDKHLNAASIKLLVGIDYDDDEVDQLIVQADANGDGYLDYADFVSSWQSLIPFK